MIAPTPTPPTPPRAAVDALDPIPRERWTLVVEVRGDGPPGIIRLRRPIKRMWRGYGLKLVDMQEAEHDPRIER